MKLIKKLIKIKSKILVKRKLKIIFDFLLTKIENSKGNLHLANIFELIGNELQRNKINSIICIINDKRNEVMVRNVNFPGKFKTIFTTENIKVIDFKKFSKYQEAIKKKKIIFCQNRLNQFKKIIPQTSKVFKKKQETNSIIAPLILRGEVIATLEILSSKLEKEDMDSVDDFVKKLVISITNNILFHAIRKSEKRYRDLFKNSSDGLVFFDIKEKCFRESNLSMKKISGYTSEELKQLHYLRLFEKKDRGRIERVISLVKDSKDSPVLPSKFCVKIITKKKEKKICNIKIGSQIDKNEICFSFNDVTKSKLAEEENIRLTEFNKKILDSSPVSIVVLDKKGKIILANGMAKKLMEDPTRKLLGRKLFDTKEIKNNKRLQAKYKILLKTGKSFCYDNLSYISKIDKQKKWLNIIAVPLYDKNRKVDGVISMAIDNTEKIVAKEKLENLNKNLESQVKNRTEELDKINKELSHVLELKSKFISDASHELRTPLTIIQGNLDLAIQEFLNKEKEIPEAYVLIAKEIEQMTSILTDLTMLTNTDAGNETISYDDIDLNLLVKTTVQSLKVLAGKKNIKLKAFNNRRLLRIVGDEAKLEKMLLNIIRNAIKYTEKKGKIKVWTEADGDKGMVKIIVKDNGMGIPKTDLPYIFERFYRVDKARSRQEGGTGLGLSICKWIVEAHHGRIEVESEVGIGSIFTIFLPYDCCRDGRGVITK